MVDEALSFCTCLKDGIAVLQLNFSSPQGHDSGWQLSPVHEKQKTKASRE